MRIHVQSKDLLAIAGYLGVRTMYYAPVHKFLDNLVKQTGDTYVVHTKWNKVQWSPGESSRIVK